MQHMEDLRSEVTTLWAEFKNKSFSAQDAKVHLGFCRVMIDTARVELANQRLRLLMAQPVGNQADAPVKVKIAAR